MMDHKVIQRFKKENNHQVIDYFLKHRNSSNFTKVTDKIIIKTSGIEGYRSDLHASLEALLFIADEPLNFKKIGSVLGLTINTDAKSLLKELQRIYDLENSSFQIEEVAGGFQLLTKSPYHTWLARLYASNTEFQISSAMKEALAIVAYRQPITRADIEQIRGVNSSEVIRNLLEKNIVRILGRENTLGRPVLYGTTRKFLQIYGLKSLKDLPKASEFGSPSQVDEGLVDDATGDDQNFSPNEQ